MEEGPVQIKQVKRINVFLGNSENLQKKTANYQVEVM